MFLCAMPHLLLRRRQRLCRGLSAGLSSSHLTVQLCHIWRWRPLQRRQHSRVQGSPLRAWRVLLGCLANQGSGKHMKWPDEIRGAVTRLTTL